MIQLLLVVVFGLSLLGLPPAEAQVQDQATLQRIRSAAQSQGRTRVIVELTLPAGQHVPEGLLGSQAAINVQGQSIVTVGAQILSRVRATGTRVLHKYGVLPLIALEVDPAGLAQLEASGLYVVRIFEDTIRYPLLYQSSPLVHAPQAWSSGFDGTGWAVAIIDAGVEATHPFLASSPAKLSPRRVTCWAMVARMGNRVSHSMRFWARSPRPSRPSRASAPRRSSAAGRTG